MATEVQKAKARAEAIDKRIREDNRKYAQLDRQGKLDWLEDRRLGYPDDSPELFYIDQQITRVKNER